MLHSDQYRLVDFGDGRKLEQFGPYLIDRPAPAADNLRKAHPTVWKNADACFLRGQRGGTWRWAKSELLPWSIEHGPLQFELKPTDSGQIGFFPEQSLNWEWLSERLQRQANADQLLNLFAYTGSGTLIAAANGAEVVHVDAVKSAVQWGKKNAERSGLGNAPVRWIVDDVRKFLARELRRSRQYDAVVLDPPSYGHGPQQEPWKIEEHLAGVLHQCGRLTQERGQFILLTCHTPSLRWRRLQQLVKENIQHHSDKAGARQTACAQLQGV